MKTAFCIEHQHSVRVQQSMVGDCHEYPVFTESGWELDWCWFGLGYATVEPVENPDWDEGLVEPEPDEEMINWDEFNQAVQDGLELELMNIYYEDEYGEVFPRWLT